MTEPLSSRRRTTCRVAAAVIVAAFAALVLIVVCVLTPLQEVSFRWMGLAGVALPAAAVLAVVVTAAALVAVLAAHPRVSVRCWFAASVVVAWAVVAVLSWPTLQGIWSPRPVADGEELTVLTQNLWYRNEEPDRTARDVLARDADVAVLVEYTPEHAAAFADAGAADLYPYRWQEPRRLGDGMAILSKVPLGDVERLPMWSTALRTELLTDAGPVALVGVHPKSPSDFWGLQRWKIDYRTLTGLLEDAGPRTLVVGDFNANGAHRRFRELKAAASLHDAADEAGAGFGPTWPAAGWVPPLMRLDHVLIGDDIDVDRVEVLDDVGADHRGVEARLRIPPP